MLVKSQSCAFRHIVSHTGGVPGFGSILLWLPDYGVGVVFGNNFPHPRWTSIRSPRTKRWYRERNDKEPVTRGIGNVLAGLGGGPLR